MIILSKDPSTPVAKQLRMYKERMKLTVNRWEGTEACFVHYVLRHRQNGWRVEIDEVGNDWRKNPNPGD